MPLLIELAKKDHYGTTAGKTEPGKWQIQQEELSIFSAPTSRGECAPHSLVGLRNCGWRWRRSVSEGSHVQAPHRVSEADEVSNPDNNHQITIKTYI